MIRLVKGLRSAPSTLANGGVQWSRPLIQNLSLWWPDGFLTERHVIVGCAGSSSHSASSSRFSAAFPRRYWRCLLICLSGLSVFNHQFLVIFESLLLPKVIEFSCFGGFHGMDWVLPTWFRRIYGDLWVWAAHSLPLVIPRSLPLPQWVGIKEALCLVYVCSSLFTVSFHLPCNFWQYLI